MFDYEEVIRIQIDKIRIAEKQMGGIKTKDDIFKIQFNEWYKDAIRGLQVVKEEIAIEEWKAAQT